LLKLGLANMRILGESDNSSSSNSNKSYAGVLLLITSFVTCLILLLIMTSLSVNPLIAQDEQIGRIQAKTNQTNNTAPQINSSLVDFASNIEQIRGHLEQAMSNKELGNNTLAKAHTLHPIDEIYSSIEGQIYASDPTLNQSLSSSLNQLSSSVDNSTIEEFKTKASDLNGLLNDTFGKVIPSQEANSTTFNLTLVADLLSVGENEYREAVENGTVTEIVEYQDGQAFISRAQSVFNQTAPMIPQEESAEVEEINEFFSDLKNAIQSKADVEVVSNSIRAIGHEISEVTGIGEEELSAAAGTGDDPVAIISEIRNLLNQTLDTYENQRYGEAETLAIQAYLDNYEFIEAPLAEQNETLMETTEVMLREELRQLIQNNASLQEIQEHVDEINTNLNQAEALLTGTG
jgi:hypothetical protein